MHALYRRHWLGLTAALAGGLWAAAAAPVAAATDPAQRHRRTSGTAGPRRGQGAAAAAQPAPAGDAQPARYAGREDVRQLAARIAAQHQLDAGWVEATLAQARYLPVVARLIMPPPKGVAKNWGAYRARFIEPDRLAAGAAFWQAHARWLQLAEQRWGVPAELVVGIIGVETFYGRVMGNFRVLDALATLSLDFPSGRSDRSPFFQDELGQLLAWTRREGTDPALVKGSYAGAIGLGQFMPGSINRHAIDFDGDGHINLSGSPADAIGSVAHYMANHGWQRGMATHFAVQAPADAQRRALLLGPDILPSFSAAQMAEHGAQLDGAGSGHAGPLALVELQMGADAPPVYIAGTQNFYAVTRYNWSAYYALAVIELGQAVAQRLQAAR